MEAADITGRGSPMAHTDQVCSRKNLVTRGDELAVSLYGSWEQSCNRGHEWSRAGNTTPYRYAFEPDDEENSMGTTSLKWPRPPVYMAFRSDSAQRYHGITGPTPSRFYRSNLLDTSSAQQTQQSPSADRLALITSSIGSAPGSDPHTPPQPQEWAKEQRRKSPSIASNIKSSPVSASSARRLSLLPLTTGLAARTTSPTDKARQKRLSRDEKSRRSTAAGEEEIHRSLLGTGIDQTKPRHLGMRRSSTLSRLPTPRTRLLSNPRDTEIPPVPPLPVSFTNTDYPRIFSRKSSASHNDAGPLAHENFTGLSISPSLRPAADDNVHANRFGSTSPPKPSTVPSAIPQRQSSSDYYQIRTRPRLTKSLSTASGITQCSVSPQASLNLSTSAESQNANAHSPSKNKTRLLGISLPRSLSRSRRKQKASNEKADMNKSSPFRDDKQSNLFYRSPATKDQSVVPTLHPLPPMPIHQTVRQPSSNSREKLATDIDDQSNVAGGAKQMKPNGDRPNGYRHPSTRNFPVPVEAPSSRCTRNVLDSPLTPTMYTSNVDRERSSLNEAAIALCDREVEKISMKRKKKDLDMELGALNRRGVKAPALSLEKALRTQPLTKYERGEIMDYDSVYFCGISRNKKQQGDPMNETFNHGYDDDRGDYILVLGDHLAYRYEMISLLGKGSFGQVVRCLDYRTGDLVAIKIIRNKKRFHKQALVEVGILQHIVELDAEDKRHVVRCHRHFYFRGHLCIVTELLSINLYEVIKANEYRGFSLALIRRITQQLLLTLAFLQQERIIHCDLKPENILLVSTASSRVKVIDFGSSCHEKEKVYTYIQSRFYRSPEVILQMSYGMPIDMWSLGCILAELYTGYPIFPGENEQEQLACIMEIFGPPDPSVLARSERQGMFFDTFGNPRPYVSSKGRRRRLHSRTLSQVLKCDNVSFLDFLTRCFMWDPRMRITPEQALQHDFVTGVSRRGSVNENGAALNSSVNHAISPARPVAVLSSAAEKSSGIPALGAKVSSSKAAGAVPDTHGSLAQWKEFAKLQTHACTVGVSTTASTSSSMQRPIPPPHATFPDMLKRGTRLQQPAVGGSRAVSLSASQHQDQLLNGSRHNDGGSPMGGAVRRYRSVSLGSGNGVNPGRHRHALPSQPQTHAVDSAVSVSTGTSILR